jgi:hypothetical protein
MSLGQQKRHLLPPTLDENREIYPPPPPVIVEHRAYALQRRLHRDDPR